MGWFSLPHLYHWSQTHNILIVLCICLFIYKQSNKKTNTVVVETDQIFKTFNSLNTVGVSFFSVISRIIQNHTYDSEKLRCPELLLINHVLLSIFISFYRIYTVFGATGNSRCGKGKPKWQTRPLLVRVSKNITEMLNTFPEIYFNLQFQTVLKQNKHLISPCSLHQSKLYQLNKQYELTTYFAAFAASAPGSQIQYCSEFSHSSSYWQHSLRSSNRKHVWIYCTGPFLSNNVIQQFLQRITDL